MQKPEVHVLREGSLEDCLGFDIRKQLKEIHLPKSNTYSCIKAPATLSLIKRYDGPHILVDAGGPWDTQKDLEKWLSEYDVKISEIGICILTHNHPDHVHLLHALDDGTIVCRPDSTYIIGKNYKDKYIIPVLRDGHKIGDYIELIKIPGHESSLDQGLIVDTNKGRVAIVGDLFLKEEEYYNPKNTDIWPPDQRDLAIKSRLRIINKIQPKIVIPGHGKEFYTKK